MKKNMMNKWYPLRVPYGRELKLKLLLDSLSIPNFVPMQYKRAIVEGRETKVLVSAIKNLIFVNSTRRFLNDLKIRVETSTPFRHIIDKSTNAPIVVPPKEMELFIAVAGTMDEQLVYLTDIKSTLKNGDKVLVCGGIFSGVEGNVVRIKKDRRVMVAIENIIAVATAYIDPVLLQRINTE